VVGPVEVVVMKKVAVAVAWFVHDAAYCATREVVGGSVVKKLHG
jgi:hypothetical protein